MNDSNITCLVLQDTEDPEQLLLDLGTELCDRLGWRVGDTLEWIDNKDGSWTLTKSTQ
jgi:hypothetical protein